MCHPRVSVSHPRVYVQVRDWKWLSPGQQVQLRRGHPVGAASESVTVTLAKRELSVDCEALWRVWLQDGREAFVAPSAVLVGDGEGEVVGKRKGKRKGKRHRSKSRDTRAQRNAKEK